MKSLSIHMKLDRTSKNYAIYVTADPTNEGEAILYLPIKTTGTPAPQRVDIAAEEVEE